MTFGGLIGCFSIMESYPLSGRWGYCGLFLDRITTQLVYGLLLLYNWSPETILLEKFSFYNLPLDFRAKSWIFWLGLFILFVVIRSGVLRTAIISFFAAKFSFVYYYINALVYFPHFVKRYIYNMESLGGYFHYETICYGLCTKKKENTTVHRYFVWGNFRYPTRIEFYPRPFYIFWSYWPCYFHMVFVKLGFNVELEYPIDYCLLCFFIFWDLF